MKWVDTFDPPNLQLLLIWRNTNNMSMLTLCKFYVVENHIYYVLSIFTYKSSKGNKWKILSQNFTQVLKATFVVIWLNFFVKFRNLQVKRWYPKTITLGMIMTNVDREDNSINSYSQRFYIIFIECTP